MSKSNNESAPFLLRNPTLSKSHVAFSYGCNIWVANRDGSELRRLTSGGREARPVLSPNGEHIAFIGEYAGPRGVFVMPVSGGEPRRITHHPDDLGPVNWAIGVGDELGWTPDGRRILFSSRRAAFAGGVTRTVQLFTAPFEGGAAVQVPLVRAAQGSFSPDVSRIAYVPHIQTQPDWKRYRGGQTMPIRIANLRDSSVEFEITRDNSNDFNPMWVGDTIYFLSDRNGSTTLFAYDLKSREVRQIVKAGVFDIKSASASSDAIIYEQFGSLHLLDVRSGEERLLDIRPLADFVEVRPHVESLADIVCSDIAVPNVAPRLSPNGESLAVGLRGEILSVPTGSGDIRNVTRTSGVAERDPAWSPDGNRIAYFSDESGEYALHVREQTGVGSTRKIHLGRPPSFYYSPNWSPDGRKIAYTDKRLNFWYVDLEDGAPVAVDRGLRVDPSDIPQDPACRLPMAWSPDSRWLAYVKVLESSLHALFVYSIELHQSYQLTDGMSDVLHVAFDEGGQHLYFTASTDVGLAGQWLGMLRRGRSVRRSVYALLLNHTVREPGVAAVSRILGRERKDGDAKVEIDLDGIMGRVVCLPVPARNYSGLFTGRAGALFLIEAPIDQPSAAGPKQVHRFDLLSQRLEGILQDVIYCDLPFGGEVILYARAVGKKRQWFVDSVQSLVGEARGPSTSITKLESLEIHVDPRAEWKHLFEQVWRVQRDFLYDPGLHGVDVDRLKERYRPFLQNIVSRNDLYYLFGEMLSNLTVSHLWVLPLEDFNRARGNTGLLGADYTVDQGLYRFARIYQRDPWDPASRAPLNEPGIRVAAGEYLLAVDGREVLPSEDVFSYFENTVGRRTVLTVGPRPHGSGSREVTVVPIDDEYSLRYFAWIDGNRRKVDELSGGRVAYVHLPDCQPNGYAAFNRHFFAQVDKEAAIIDNRYNNGGALPDYIIDCLKRPLACYWHMREGRDWAAPSLSIFGPKVMLINEMSCSMGDALPWLFRKAGIGPSIGKRTWGGLVGSYNYVDDLLDHGVLTHPNLAFYTPDGKWEIENYGVQPDYEVTEDPGAARLGHDVQLEKAVDVVMELLNRNPPPTPPQRPPYPRYSR